MLYFYITFPSKTKIKNETTEGISRNLYKLFPQQGKV